MSEEMPYYERLRKKVERMEKEWIEYNMTDQLINDFLLVLEKNLMMKGYMTVNSYGSKIF